MTPRLAALALIAALPAEAQDAAIGADIYYTYCASCHGDGAEGDGPMTEILNVTPADLTGLAARNGGRFPTVMVAYRIDGRDPIAAHGGPMPFFGDILGDPLIAMKTQSGQPLLLGEGIADLIAFLETIQD